MMGQSGDNSELKLAEAEALAAFDIHTLSSQPHLMREILTPGPRNLVNIQAELLFLDGGQFVFHSRQGQPYAQAEVADQTEVDADDTELEATAARQGRLLPPYNVRSVSHKENFKFLSPDQVKAAFVNTPVDSGFLPSNVLRWGTGLKGDWMVRFVPPAIHDITLDEGQGQFLIMQVPLPGFVFAGIGTDYFVWAVKETRFEQVSVATRLYHAPLPNVDSIGKICYGANRPPAVGSVGALDQAWRLFIQSAPFNSHHANGKSFKYIQDVRQILRELDLSAVGRPGLREAGLLLTAPGLDEETTRLALTGQEDEIALTPREYPLSDLVAIMGRINSGYSSSVELSLAHLIDHCLVIAK